MVDSIAKEGMDRPTMMVLVSFDDSVHMWSVFHFYFVCFALALPWG